MYTDFDEYAGLSVPLNISYTYNPDGSVNIDSVSGADTEYSVTQYEYDKHGNMTVMIDPLGKRETREIHPVQL